MSALFYCAVLSCAFALSRAVPGTVCTTNDQCDDGECCQIWNEQIVASKKDLISTPLRTGTCELYGQQGEVCNPIAVVNGACGCDPGLVCHYEPYKETTFTARGKRLLLTGTYTCERE